ncbi:hypothetical protein [Hamadaea tsunoensis]|uniref:hypothetical protein n=1 Tax=Hamadaea tsunoensis TaxID=53368 RepID=UPI000422880F|nr:hypothetical protein [Hamadaea tsunoensis]
MYAWIWRRLPGPWWARLAAAFALTGGVVALLWYFAFPWAEPLLPFDDVQVGNPVDVVPGQDVVPYPTVDNSQPGTPQPSASVAG